MDGKVYNLGSGVGRKLKDYVQDVIDVVNPDYVPDYGKYPYSKTQPMCLVTDVSDLKNDIDWEADITFTEGLKRILK